MNDPIEKRVSEGARLPDRLVRAARRWRDGGTGGVESGRYLAKWTILAVLIGGVAGLGAVIFFRAIGFVNAHLLGALAGVHAPEPLGEGGDATIRPFGRPWLVPVIAALGGLASGLLVFLLAPEAEGHGTDAAIAAFHHKAGAIRARIAPIKLVASAITIGSGGSAGREGPAAQISATFGSLLADLLGLSAADRRLCVAVGMGAGIGAIFRAPLGGAMLAAEILYVHDMETEALIPSLIAAITGYAIFGAFTGWEPIFGAQPGIVFDQPVQLLYFALLGLVCGLVGLLYARGFYGIEHLFQRLPLPRIVKPALGGLAVGLLALAMPQVLGTGYGWVQLGMDRRLLDLPLWVVLLLPFAKILTTGLSIGSGGSGGIFGPGMVIGGLTGAGFWRVAHDTLPGMPAQPASFTIVAMMALFGGIAHAPLAVMIMVAEMTGNLSLLAPAMVAVGLATLVVGDHTIYRSQLARRVDSPAHRYRYAFPLLTTLTVGDALEPAPLVVRVNDLLAEAAASLAASGAPGVPVLDAHGRVVGVLTTGDVARATLTSGDDNQSVVTVNAAMGTLKTRFTTAMPLDDALDSLASTDLSWAPALDADGERLAGLISVPGIVAAYRAGLARDVRRADGIATGMTLLDVQVRPGSPLLAGPLRDLPLPAGLLLVARRRGDAVSTPRGDTTFAAGDVVTVLTGLAEEAAARRFFAARGAEGRA